MTEQERVRRLAIEVAGEPLASFHPGWTPYHTIDDAWVLVKRLREKGYHLALADWSFEREIDCAWSASFDRAKETTLRSGPQKHGPTATAAICEAALAVLDAGA